MPTPGLGVIFILGAGASTGAGIPGTEEITEAVLSGQGIKRASNGACYILPHDGSPLIFLDDLDLYRVDAEAVTSYLNYLWRLACECYSTSPSRVVSYEDIYYLAERVRDAVWGRHKDPLAEDRSRVILREVGRSEQERRSCSMREAAESVEGIVKSAQGFVRAIVASLVARDPRGTDHLRLIAEAWRNGRVGGLNVATLNHDRVIDRFLMANGIPYTDGFDDACEAKDGFRRFRPDVYDLPGRVGVLKLHGGIDWSVRGAFDDDPWANEIGVLTEPHSLGFEEELLLSSLAVQIGVQNKVMNYTLYRHLSVLQHRFLHALEDSDLMIVSGYSFGDMGVNARIRNWIYGRRGRRLVVIDPHAGNVMNCFQSDWYQWKAAKAAFSMRRGIEDASWDDVLELAEA